MIETIIVKWYCIHCDAFNRTEVRAKGTLTMSIIIVFAKNVMSNIM
ncbi:hypothetical protein HFP67_29025 [Bacillus sp. CB102A.1]